MSASAKCTRAPAENASFGMRVSASWRESGRRKGGRVGGVEGGVDDEVGEWAAERTRSEIKYVPFNRWG